MIYLCISWSFGTVFALYAQYQVNCGIELLVYMAITTRKEENNVNQGTTN